MKREQWGSRTSFILAAVGSAVGLGNAWRFPGQAAKYGGGTFLLIYIFALIIAGFPLLLMELTIGRKMQQGAPGSMRGLNKKFEWVGWAPVGVGFVISCYYAVVLAWVLVMCTKAFGIAGHAEPGSIFTSEVLQISDGPLSLGGFSMPVLIALAISWIAIYVCIRKGTSSVGKVVKYTVFIPLVILVILAINGLTLPGAMMGMKEYLIPDWTRFGDVDVWIAAFGQVFYSLSIMMAIMFAYGSFLPKDTDLPKDTMIIVLSDALISIIAGVVIFTTLGYMSYTNGTEFAVPEGGIGLAFVLYPQVLALLPGGPVVQTIMSILFYVALLTLAIDSAFSIVEGVSTAVADKFRLNKRKTTFSICCVAGAISLLFATKAGLYWLDIVDAWANNVDLILIGVLECLVVGWFFGVQKVREEANATSSWKIGKWFDITIKFICPIMFAAMFIIFFVKSLSQPYEGYDQLALFLGGWLMSILVFASGLIIQVVSRRNKKIVAIEANDKSWEEM